MPVLVGAGQSVSRWNGSDGPTSAPSPLSLATEAATAALADSGVAARLRNAIDLVAFVRTHADSLTRPDHPHGSVTSLPVALAAALGIKPSQAIYSSVGGQTPQAMVNEVAQRIHSGEIAAALIVGAEAMAASRTAVRRGVELDWSVGDAGDGSSMGISVDDRGLGERLLSRAEIKHGLIAPAYFYALIECALASHAGRTRSGHRSAMAKLFAPFSRVAAGNPYAQFAIARDPDFLASPTIENYELADPFLKWHVAQDAVNQGAALILVGERLAREIGIDPARYVYLHGCGEANERLLSERETLASSSAMRSAITQALAAAGRACADIDLFDIYSCFPCAVFCAAEALGVDTQTDPRLLTVTGGLPFFGGPGNNYSLHAIAAMLESLRQRPGGFGLVLANGGWMTKEAVGVYSTARPATFAALEPPVNPPGSAVPLIDGPAEAVVETHTVTHGRAGPEAGIAFLRTASGARIIARATPTAIGRLREDRLAVGETVSVTAEGGINVFEF